MDGEESNSMIDGSGILVGLGSVGLKHAKHLLQLTSRVLVIENAKEFNQRQLEVLENDRVTLVPSFEAIESKLDFDDPSIGVVASHGPDHASHASQLISLGAKKLVVEKPFATSLRSIDDLVRLAKDEGVTTYVPTLWRLSKSAMQLRTWQNEEGLGKCVQVTWTSGAKGFSEMGTHVIDLANFVLGTEPKSIISQLSSSLINPRNSQLDYFGGVAGFQYDGDGQLVIALSNASAVSGPVQFWFEEAVVELHFSGLLRLISKKRDSAVRITQTFEVSQAGVLEEQFESGQLWTEFYNLIAADKQFNSGVAASRLMVLALAASHTGSRILTDVKVPSSLYDRCWNVT